MMPILIRREIWERRAEYLWIPMILAVLALLPSAFVASQWQLWVEDFEGTVIIDLGDDKDTIDHMMGPESEIGPGLNMHELPAERPSADSWDFHQRWLKSGEEQGLSQTVIEQFFSDEEDRPKNLSLNVVAHFVFCAFLVLWLLVSILYLLDALYRERRDRSHLFWQSMPVPEWKVVLAKLISAWILTSLVFWLASLIPQWVLVWSVTQLPNEGLKLTRDFSLIETVQTQLSVLAEVWLVSLPLPAWLLLVSSRANKIPMLWAFLVPAALAIVEFWWFGSTVVWNFIQFIMPSVGITETTGGWALQGGGSGDVATLTVGTVLSIAALAGAVYFRRQQH